MPFIARWPGKIPAGWVSNEIVHEMDLYPTIARIVGGQVPRDRMIDGVDQLDFFLGNQQASNRESVVIYAGSELMGVKWRHFKLVFKEIDQAWGNPTRSFSTPLLIDLQTDPKEEHPLDPDWIHLGWVRWPAGQVLSEHQASFQQEPPIPIGAPDSYRPGKR